MAEGEDNPREGVSAPSPAARAGLGDATAGRRPSFGDDDGTAGRRPSFGDDDTVERTCPSCGVTSRTRYEQCPSCRRSYFAPPPPRDHRRRRALAVAGALVVLAGAAVAVPAFISDKRDHDRRSRAELARLVASERAQIARVQRPHTGAARALRPAAGATRAAVLAARAALVAHVQRRITTYARGRAGAGELEGPIASTRCGPFLRSPDAVPDDRDPAKPIGRYDCVAIKRDVRDVSGSVASLGYPFVAALDFRRFTYTWCRNTPAQGERGQALVFVRLDRRCLAARGRAMGTGYADVPDR